MIYDTFRSNIVCSLSLCVASRGGRDLQEALKKYQNEVKDVYSTCIVAETIDERPSAYKDSEIITQALHPTADIITRAKTVLNVKGF